MQHVVSTDMPREPPGERPGKGPRLRALARKVEVANAVLAYGLVQSDGQLSAPVGGRGRDIDRGAQRRENFCHASDRHARPAVEHGDAGNHMKYPHVSTPFRSSHSSNATSTHTRDQETERPPDRNACHSSCNARGRIIPRAPSRLEASLSSQKGRRAPRIQRSKGRTNPSFGLWTISWGRS